MSRLIRVNDGTPRDTQHQQYYLLRPAAQRMIFAGITLVCLFGSVWLLYTVTALHFATGSWVLLDTPTSDPRPQANLDRLAVIPLQIIGGIALCITCLSGKNNRRNLKWSPVFIIAFALFTWLTAVAVGPWGIG